MDRKKIVEEIVREIYSKHGEREEMATQLEILINKINLEALETLSLILKKKIILDE
tara:strand:+ start:37636 stop:37803 length:168 start_codon:yes stop_codon:yes gene_type:complete